MTSGRDRRKAWLGRIHVASALVSLVFLGFLWGAAAVEYRVFPHGHMVAVFRALRAQHERLTVYGHGAVDGERAILLRSNLWRPSRGAESGVLVHDDSLAFSGLTFYTSGHQQGAVLIDMDGRVVHEWRKRFREIWPNPTHLSASEVVAPELILWRRAHLFPNGDVLVVYIGWGITPWGYGLAKLDKNSDLLWRYDARVHHDVAVGFDGRILTLTHELRSDPIEGVPHIAAPMLEDFVVLLSADGTPLRKVSVLDALAASPYKAFFNLVPAGASERGDILHVNSVKFIPLSFARHHDLVEAGQALLVLREIDTVAALDLDAGRVVWASRLPATGPHDADPLDNGHVLVFDNGLRYGAMTEWRMPRSRVLEVDPASGAVAWIYGGDSVDELSSPLRSVQQRLPNGNVLITESDGGRLLEVTRAGSVVWEYVNPASMTTAAGASGRAVLCGGARFAREDLPFLGDNVLEGASGAR